MSALKLNGTLSSDSSNGSCDSGLDDQHHTMHSLCDSSNITSMDEVSVFSQHSLQRQPPHFKVPRVTTNYGSLDIPSTSNTCSGISSSTCINDEETSDTTLGASDHEHTKKKSDDLCTVQALLKAIIKNASGSESSTALDNMTLKDLKTELNMTTEENKSAISEERSPNFKLSMVESLCTGNSSNTFQLGNESSKSKYEFSLYNQYSSKHENLELKIVSQPETQHRARYMTEGSRGAVKDRSGNGFPTLKLFGYRGEQPPILQVFIAADNGINAAPHLFYQASRVCNKNSPPCHQKIIQGCVIIELEICSEQPAITVDCVGILKERNVDVEQRVKHLEECVTLYKTPSALKAFKKRSTKCRLAFRVIIPPLTEDIQDNVVILQVLSGSILCTQPQGIPEICRQSLSDCHCNGGSDLFIIGKNFTKDSKVVFQDATDIRGSKSAIGWQEIVIPDKDYLQPNHLICKIPPYDKSSTLKSTIRVQFSVQSGGKKSEPHFLSFHPVDTQLANVFMGNNIESRLLGSAVQNHQTMPPLLKVNTSPIDSSNVYKPEDLKVIPGAKVVKAEGSQPSQPKVFIILPGSSLPNGQSQILPVVTSAPVIPPVIQKPEVLVPQPMANCSNENPIGNAETSLGVQSQTMNVIVVPQTLGTSNSVTAAAEESFALNKLLVQQENQQLPVTSINTQIVSNDIQDTLFHDKKPLINQITNEQLSSSEPQPKVLKSMGLFEDSLTNQTGITQQSIQNLNQQQFNNLQQQIQQEQIHRNLQTEFEQNLMQHQQKIQQDQMNQVLQSHVHQIQHQEMNGVLQSQVQELHKEQQLEREREIKINQQIIQQVRQNFQEKFQERQLSLEIQQQQHIQQSIHNHINLQQEQAFRAIEQGNLHLDFEQKLSPAEKQQLENGLQQIQQEQHFQQELQKLEQKVCQGHQLQNGLERLQQEHMQELQQVQHQLERKRLEEGRLLQQETNKSPHLQFQLQDTSLIQGAIKSPIIVGEITNKTLWPAATSVFSDSIPTVPKLENNFFFKESPESIENNNQTSLTPPSIATIATSNFPSQMDTTFGNTNSCMKNIFGADFQVHSSTPVTNTDTFSSVSSLPSNPTSISFTNTSVTRNDVGIGIENMDISVSNTVCKREDSRMIETTPMVTNPVFVPTETNMHVMDNSSILPMALNNNIPRTLPVLNAVETQFLNSDNIFSTNIIPNGATGLAQNKPEHNNLPMLGSDIFENNILGANQQIMLNTGKLNETGKLVEPQGNFLHSGLLQTISTPMVLGRPLDESARIRDIKTTLMDTSVSQSDRMDTSFLVTQASVNCMPNGAHQVSDIMKMFHN